ncbi:hypothetical protein GGI35DRAFT_250745 [Trichoderma velutinum]
MDFFIVWVLILCANLAAWTILSRCYSLRQVLARLVIVKRTSPSDDDSSLPRSVAAEISHLTFGRVKSWLLSLYDEDDLNVTGFHPARVLRFIITIWVISQNALALAIIRDGGVREALRRSGQLACANLLPLALLAFPNLGIARLVSQPGPQIVWAHAVFGWMIWYEVLVHVGLSFFYLSGPQTTALLVGGGFAGLLLYATLLNAIYSQCMHLQRGLYMSVYSHYGQRRWYIAHLSLASAFLSTLIIHVWSRPLHVAAIIATIIIQIAGMPARVPPISPDQPTFNEANQNHGTKHGKQAAFTSGLGNVLTILRQTQQKQLDNLGPKYKILSVVALSAGSEGEDSYFKINGTPIRMAWLERDEEGRYKAILIVDERLIRQGLHIEGPYIIPPSPYITIGPCDMNVITMDSGILEAYSCLRWRSITFGRNHQTKVIWFSQDINLVRIFVNQLRVMKGDVTVIWYGVAIQESMLQELKLNEYVDFRQENDPWKRVLPIYTRRHRRRQRRFSEIHPFIAMLARGQTG